MVDLKWYFRGWTWPYNLDRFLFGDFFYAESTMGWKITIKKSPFGRIICLKSKIDNDLGCGLNHVLLSSLLGEVFPFWLIFFKWVEVQPPTSDKPMKKTGHLHVWSSVFFPVVEASVSHPSAHQLGPIPSGRPVVETSYGRISFNSDGSCNQCLGSKRPKNRWGRFVQEKNMGGLETAKNGDWSNVTF